MRYFKGTVSAGLVIAVFMGVTTFSFAQSERAFREPTPTELLKYASVALEAKHYDEAVPLLFKYLSKVSSSTAPRVIALAQETRYKLAKLLISLERRQEASGVLDNYINTPYGKQRRKAMKMLAKCYFALPDYARCISSVTNALYHDANPDLYESELPASAGYSADAAKSRALMAKFNKEEAYTHDELVAFYMMWGESCFELGQYEECIPAYQYVSDTSLSDQQVGYSIMQIINALVSIPDFPRVLDFVPKIYETQAKYDIRVNIGLLEAATALYEDEDYDSALKLYRLIRPKAELLAYHTERLRTMRINAGLTPEDDMKLTDDELLLFGQSRQTQTIDNDVVVNAMIKAEETPEPIVELEQQIKQLKELADYHANVKFSMAMVYRKVNRNWEALTFFKNVYELFPEEDIGAKSIYEVVDLLLNKLNDLDEAKEYAFDYLVKKKKGLTPRRLLYLFNGYYQRSNDLAAIKSLLPYLDALARSNNETILKYDVELYYMQAVADLMMMNYEIAEKSFKRLLDEFPGSRQEVNASYWYGMTKVYQQKYNEGLGAFENFYSQFKDSNLKDEAFFQGGVCLFGMEKYPEAKARFSKLIEKYPDSTVFPEACSMRADLYASDGELDLAEADYRLAINKATKVSQASYAVFEMASMFDLEKRFDEIIVAVEDYLAKWGEEADIAKSLFWIGKTKIQQDLIDEAIQSYVDAIAKFGDDPQQEGVDMMIAELVKIALVRLDDADLERLKQDLQIASNAAADKPTLQLRIRITLAKLNHEEIALGKVLLKELKDMETASPPVLAAICDASFDLEDYSRAGELLDIFLKKFSNSDFIRAAFKLRAFGQYEAKAYEGALDTIEEAQERFGVDYDVVWAQLLRAKINAEQNYFDLARTNNLVVVNEPNWRGEPVAQAVYQLGELEEKAGNIRKAFGYYQRVYVQYKGHAKGYWAAEAYLASARCLKALGLSNDRRNTYRAMLYDRYINSLPQAHIARTELGASEVAEIEADIASGLTTNIAVKVESGEGL